MSEDTAPIIRVREYFLALQDKICTALEEVDGKVQFSRQHIPGEGDGFAQPRVLAEGDHIEKAAVQFTHSVGKALPAAATERNPHLAGSGFQATAISLIVHPTNPFVPTTHMNLRYFTVDAQDPVWYFGGGYDLTPTYANRADIVHWHEVARKATGEHYQGMKEACDDYFYLPHRGETRGVGGLFFDDWTTGGFDAAFVLVKQIGDSFLDAYLPIFKARMHSDYSAKQRDFQLYRRGRYAEFNLAIDRGTKYGLQSGRRVESVLASLPPLARWVYEYPLEPGSLEAELTEKYLHAQDWL